MQTVASGRILAGNAGAEAAAEKGLGAAVRLRGARELRNREVSGWERKAGSERRWEQSYWHWSEAEARWSAAGASPASSEASAARRRRRERARWSAQGRLYVAGDGCAATGTTSRHNESQWKP